MTTDLSRPVLILTAVAVLGAATVGGVLFAFSGFVMAGLTRLPAPQGIAAMQSINVTAVRPPLMVALFGTAALCLGLGVHAVAHWGDRRALLVLMGGALYLLGVIGLTAAYHVPHNDALAAIDPAAAASPAYWTTWVEGWTRWNHVRAAAGIGASALLGASLLV